MKNNSLVLLKPEVLIRRRVGSFLSRFEDLGFEVARIACFFFTRELCQKHYKEYIEDMLVFENILYSLSIGISFALEVTGENAIQTIRKHTGYFRPEQNAPDSLRGKYSNSLLEGSWIHASDTVELSKLELERFFSFPLNLKDYFNKKLERALFIIKPDGIKRKLAGRIISVFEKKGFLVSFLKISTYSALSLKTQYKHILESKPEVYYNMEKELINKKILIGILEGSNVLSEGRKLVGDTFPEKASPESIRGRFSPSISEGNLVHFSDSEDSYLKEKELYLPELL